MPSFQKAGFVLLAALAFAAVVSAQKQGKTVEVGPKTIVNQIKIVEKPKTVKVVPDVILRAATPRGKPEPFPRTIFVKNNTFVKVHEAKVMPNKFKEDPIKDNTIKPDVLKWDLNTRFVKNNTFIKVHQAKVKPNKFKEDPIKDNTVKPDVWKWQPRTNFELNNTIVKTEIVKQEVPKFKEVPVVDITQKFDGDFKAVEKEAKEEHKELERRAQEEFNRGQ